MSQSAPRAAPAWGTISVLDSWHPEGSSAPSDLPAPSYRSLGCNEPAFLPYWVASWTPLYSSLPALSRSDLL